MNFDVIRERTERHLPDPLLSEDTVGAWIACDAPEDLRQCR